MKNQVKQYLETSGFKDFKIQKSGEFLKISVWDAVTFERAEKIKGELNALCGTLKDPKYSWLNVCDIHFGNVRFC